MCFICTSIGNVMFILLLEKSAVVLITASTIHDSGEASSTASTADTFTAIPSDHSIGDQFYESLSSPVKIAIFSTAIGAFLFLIGLVRIMSAESRYMLNMSQKLCSDTKNKYEEDKTPTRNKTSKLKSTTGTTTTEKTGRNKVEPTVRSLKTNLKRTAPSLTSRKKDNTDTTTTNSPDISTP